MRAENYQTDPYLEINPLPDSNEEPTGIDSRENIPEIQSPEAAFERVVYNQNEYVRYELNARLDDEPGSTDVNGSSPEIAPIDNPSIETEADGLRPLTEQEIGRIGIATNSASPQAIWEENIVNVVNVRGREQGGLSEEQSELNATLANQVFSDEGAELVQNQTQEVTGLDLAAIARASGLSLERLDANQLMAATSYINDATTYADQRERLRKTIDNLTILDQIGHPKLQRLEMVGHVWETARVPSHAIEKMSDSELAKTYQDVARTLNGPAGEYKFKVGKHNVTLTVNDQHQMIDSETKKPSVWAKVGKIALTVASFIPGPIGIAARIGSSIWSAAEGIKNKNWVQAAIGAASGVAAGATALGQKALATVASGTASVLRGTQAGFNAIKNGSLSAGFEAVASVAGGVADIAGRGADNLTGFAHDMENVARFTTGASQATRAIEAARQGDWFGATSNALTGATNMAGGLENNGLAEQFGRYAGYAQTAQLVQTSLRSKDYLGAGGALMGFASNYVNDENDKQQLQDWGRVLEGAGGAQQAIQRNDWLAAAASGTEIAAAMSQNESLTRGDLESASRVLEASSNLRSAIETGDINAVNQAVEQFGNTITGEVRSYTERRVAANKLEEERAQIERAAAALKTSADEAYTALESVAQSPRATGGFATIAQDGLNAITDAQTALDDALKTGDTDIIRQAAVALDDAKLDALERAKLLENAFRPIELQTSPQLAQLDLTLFTQPPTTTTQPATNIQTFEAPKPSVGIRAGALRVGSNGQDVATLQRQLNQALGINLEVDGKFGLETEQVLREFQTSRGLDDDGIAGPNTLAQLGIYTIPRAYETVNVTANVSDPFANRNGVDRAPQIRAELNAKLDAPSGRTPAQEEQGFFSSVAEGAIKGDFSDNNSWSKVGGQTLAGLIPIWGQISDARDTAAALKKVWNGEDGGWPDLFFAGVGWIPGAGDAVKGGWRVARGVGKTAIIEGAERIGKTAIKEGTERIGREAAENLAEEVTQRVAREATDFSGLRLPKTEGQWTGQLGNSSWRSDIPEVNTITNGKPVPFKNGFPDFSEWSVGEVKLNKMSGVNNTDFGAADRLYAQQKGWLKPNGMPDRERVEQLRRANKLTWHHVEDGRTMQLVPTDLNAKIPHTGGASLARKLNSGG